jgi:hypothetical protein
MVWRSKLSDEGQARRASQGELTFTTGIPPEIEVVVSEMWRNRLAGFRNIDIVEYLRDDWVMTRYVSGRIELGAPTYHHLIRMVFWVRRLSRFIGIQINADLLDARVKRTDGIVTTRGTLVVAVGRLIIRQSLLEMSTTQEGQHWRWGQATETKVRRSQWKYRSSA